MVAVRIYLMSEVTWLYPTTWYRWVPRWTPLFKTPGSASKNFLEGARGILSRSALVAKIKTIFTYRNSLLFKKIDLWPIKIQNIMYQCVWEKRMYDSYHISYRNYICMVHACLNDFTEADHSHTKRALIQMLFSEWFSSGEKEELSVILEEHYKENMQPLIKRKYYQRKTFPSQSRASFHIVYQAFQEKYTLYK